MKKLLLGSVLCLINLSALAQNNCSEIEKENLQLKQKMSSFGIDLIPNETVIEFDSELLVNLIKVEGNKKTQVVTVTYNIVNKSLPHQMLELQNRCMALCDYKSGAYDELGNSLTITNLSLGKSKISMSAHDSAFENLNTNSNLVGKVMVGSVLPSTAIISRLELILSNINLSDFGKAMKGKLLTFRKLKINWK